MFNIKKISILVLIVIAFLFSVSKPPTVSAMITQQINLGQANSFAVLAGTTITNTGNTLVSGDIGVKPGGSVAGFPPGGFSSGFLRAGDSVSQSAVVQGVTNAYYEILGRYDSKNITGDLSGQTLTSDVYTSTSSISINGTLTLDGEGNPYSVFIFRITPESDPALGLNLAQGAKINLINGAQSCNIFWKTGYANLGDDSVFKGTILATVKAELKHGARVDGRIIGRDQSSISLDTNTITSSQSCNYNYIATPSAPPQPPVVTLTPTTTPPTTTTSLAAELESKMLQLVHLLQLYIQLLMQR